MFQFRKLEELTKLDNNPRFIETGDFKRLCKSLEDNPDYFYARPIILSDRTGELVIIAGNQRYEAARHIGYQEVPTYLLQDLSEEREKEICIRDNVNNGQWNYETLANEWDADLLVDWGIEIPVDLSLLDEETHQVIEKTTTKFGITIETEIKSNFEKIKAELDRLQIEYKEFEK